VRLLVAGLALVLVAGCGNSAKPVARKTPRPAQPECSPKIAAAAGPGAKASVVSREPDLVTCRYTAAGRVVRVTVDTMPQAWFRWMRAQVERIQTAAEWAHVPSQQPRDVRGVGGGAFWVSAPRELVASDGKRLVTVRVVRPKAAAKARRAAIAVAKAGLGPVQIPKRTGP
jgi:hypothetical protein